MATEIVKVKGNWQEVVDDCRSTVNKPPLGHEPSESFKKSILIAEHSPIRDITIKWRWPCIKSWIATHFSRHKWECFIRTQRSDRTGINRDELPQGAEVEFTGEANVQALIDTMRKRLCYQAAPETRQYAESLRDEIRKIDPDIASVLVPNCIYRCGCPERKSCGEWMRFAIWVNSQHIDITVLASSIQNRYDLYQRYITERMQ